MHHNYLYYNNDNQKTGRSRLLLSAQQQPLLKGCAVELLDYSTGVQIVLLGCFHGSRSSAMDVERAIVLSESTTDGFIADSSSNSCCEVIVLELCAQRFADLRRDNAVVVVNSSSSSSTNNLATADENNEGNTDVVIATTTTSTRTSNSSAKLPWISRYAKRIRQTRVEQGWPAAVAAALLGGVSGLQTAVSSMQPGLEFITALQIAQRHSIDIVLADQAVDRTLLKMGHLFETGRDLWKEFWITGSWDETFGKEATALRNALWGDDSLRQLAPDSNKDSAMQVSLPSFLTRNDAAIQDLFRLIVPPFFILQAFNLILTKWLEFLFHPMVVISIDSSTSTIASESDWGWIPLLVLNIFLLAMGYVGVALPSTQIIIRERDDILTQGISKACQLAAKQQQRSKNRTNSTSMPRVVAVLGFLHVNGVAQRLMEKNREWEKSNTT